MKRFLLFCTLTSFLLLAFTPFDKTIRGVVTDEKGQPIPFASIVIKGARKGTACDAKGVFSMKVESDSVIVVVAALNFEDKEVLVYSDKENNIQLKTKTATISEVVVSAAMGIKRDRVINSGYSNSTMPIESVLQGKVAGVALNGNQISYDEEKEEENNDNYGYYNNDFNTEGYDHITENPFLKVNDNPLSTFSIDVDAASYSNVRRFINMGQLPPAGGVRIEEMINYFSYDYPQPANDAPFGVNMELSACPWNNSHQLVLIGLQGRKVETENLPPSNIVFLIDVSGSMDEPNKLPLVQSSLKLLTEQLRAQDRVAIVVYAGNAGLVLPSTSGADKQTIIRAIDNLQAGGSTAGGAGIQLAYKTAMEHFMKEGNNRVILCTDGDFNVGLSSDDALEKLIEEKRQSNVFLTVLGFGTGNYQDAKMQKLADKGNGNHAYIDGIAEAKKVLINEFGGTLFTIAKDVKLQLEFNPDQVKAYRLIGYENRMLAKEDFNNDKKDAGELGSGHTVTALYEIIPANSDEEITDSVDALRYQKIKHQKITNTHTDEVLTAKLRYKEPTGDNSRLLQFVLKDDAESLNNTSVNFRFAASVAAYGMLLRNSEYKGKCSFRMVEQLASGALGNDAEGYRKEFLNMVNTTSLLEKTKASTTAVE